MEIFLIIEAHSVFTNSILVFSLLSLIHLSTVSFHAFVIFLYYQKSLDISEGGGGRES